MMELDKISMLVTTDTDHTVQEIEDELKREGYTLNYHAVPHNELLLADVLNDRVPNLYAGAYGGSEDLCVRIQLAQPDSSVYANVLAPRSATGPSLKKAAIGSGEMLGIPVQATLKIFYKPAVTEVACILFSNPRQMEFFVQAVYKYRIPLPLACPFSGKVIKKFFEGFDRDASILSLAFWGEAGPVEALSAYLRELASRKHGDWVDAGKGKIKTDLLKALHEEAIKFVQRELKATEDSLSHSHREVARLIQNIL
jgi:FAD/FMN-containing dehydrogenase